MAKTRKPKLGVRPGDSRSDAPEATEPPAENKGEPDLKKHPFFKHAQTRWIKRSLVKPADYNPRTIDLNAQVKLKQGLREFGCVEPLIWNEETGNLVGGHQRLSVMDAEVDYKEVNGTPENDYDLEVSVVKLSPAEEKTLNVLLNNPGAQGWWEWDALKKMIAAEKDFDIDLAAFDPVLLQASFEQFTADDPSLDLTHVFGKPEEDPAQADADQIAEMKATKDDHKATEGEYSKDGFYFQVIARVVAEKERFLSALGFSTYTKAVELRDLVLKLNDLIKRGKPIDIGWTPPADPAPGEPEGGGEVADSAKHNPVSMRA